ncbi:3D domain-containing protein [Calditerricola satsumensis]|uniref:G5 domain-containing protein n=1 Tax=Calditerricola satsumensis TaxID=373054 RepID=A0A8J3BEL0_9BACI|nr:3D domain-containing protein [Calditerricola satsumensis]GGK03031.1 hypothetical protein GCM10007043_16330 [Calditerricola satsumensis]
MKLAFLRGASSPGRTPRVVAWVCALVAVTASLLAMGFGRMSASDAKAVTLAVEGRETVVRTEADTVAQLLREQGVAVGPRDRVMPAPDAPLSPGMRVSVERARLLTFRVGSTTFQRAVAARTVQEALLEAGVTLGPLDRVSPGLRQPVASGLVITVTRVEERLVQEEKVLKPHVVKTASHDLPAGDQRMLQKGKAGKAVVTYRVRLENGVEVARDLVDRDVIAAPQPTVIAVGTLRGIERQGVTFLPRRVLHNVMLTAYGPGVVHTGKGPDHPLYGITALGTRAKEGRTIAVDPAVIPLGWWVYIEGLGFRRAEDTGGSVKGKKIDVYFETDALASRFGLKRGHTVYVIGPHLPRGAAAP